MASKWSIASEDSILCIASRGSVLSIGSVGSVASICSIGSAASVLGIGTALSFGSLLSSRSHGGVLATRGHPATSVPATPATPHADADARKNPATSRRQAFIQAGLIGLLTLLALRGLPGQRALS